MIVKNEALTLPRLFASLAGQVDYYVISDTGSTDDTLEVLSQLGLQYGIPGEVHHHPWVNFAYNRNKALEAALEARQQKRHDCGWLMIMDADEEFEVSDDAWKDHLRNGRSYSTYKQTDNWAMKYPFLLWIDGNDWVWKGEIHNYIVHQSDPKRFEFIESVAIIYHTFEGAKSHAFSNSLEKAISDIIQLKKELSSTSITASNAFRYFQLAFAYRNAEDYQKAIEEMDLVVNCPGISNDRYYTALIFIASLLLRNKLDPAKSRSYLEKAIATFPERKEAYFYLSNWYRQQGDSSNAFWYMEKAYATKAVNPDAVYLERSIYTWKTAYQFAFLLFQAGKFQRAGDVVGDLLQSRHLPESERAFIAQLGVRITDQIQNVQSK
jgi:glycosyltransferase involved in cell wall biosynthesis